MPLGRFAGGSSLLGTPHFFQAENCLNTFKYYLLLQIFNGEGGDRGDAANVMILFTDGVTTDTNKVDQFEEAKKLKDAGVKVITLAMGSKNFIDQSRQTLQKLASVDEDTGQVLQFASGFENLNDLTAKLVKEAC